MSKQLPLLILLGAVVLIGVLFFRVVQPFVLPLLFAAVLALLFRPVHGWISGLLRGHRRIAASATTTLVIGAIMLPLTGVLTLAGIQLVDAGKSLVQAIQIPANPEDAEKLLNLDAHPYVRSVVEFVKPRLSEQDEQQIRGLISNALASITQTVYERTQGLVADAVTITIGILIMFLALYYFLADGDKIVAEVHRLFPLAEDDKRVLLQQFDNVCRGVVLGTAVAALVQGILAAIGFSIIGVDKVWLLSVCTMFFSFIPFLGAAVVWVCVTIGLLFEQRFGAAIFLAIYGVVLISGVDNLIKAHVLHGRAQMHPLVALVTVLGALQLVGLWGIFVGPIVAAFFYALLNILRKKLYEKSATSGDQSLSSTQADAAA